MSELQHVSLFSGVGGIDQAAHDAGIPTLLACEIDYAARGVLHDQFPNVILHDDVTKVTADDFRSAGAVPTRTIVSAGWPCQGNSVAGARGGMDDARSGLWSEVARLLAEFRPAWFVGENVPGLLSVHGGRDFGAVLGDLADLGYGFAWRVLDAQYVGVPQQRRRVVLVGRLGDDGRAPAEVLLEPESSSWDSAPRLDQAPDPATRAARRVAATLTAGVSRPGVSAPGRRQEDDVNLVVSALTTKAGATYDDQQINQLVVSSLTASHGGADDNDAQAGHLVVCVTGDRTHSLTAEGSDASEDGTGRGTPIVAFHVTQDPISGAVSPAMGTGSAQGCATIGVHRAPAVRRLTPLECERLQGWPDNWTATSWGKPQADSPRYKQCGNGVARPVFSWVFNRIQLVERTVA